MGLLLCGVTGVWESVATEAGENSELRHETDLCQTTYNTYVVRI